MRHASAVTRFAAAHPLLNRAAGWLLFAAVAATLTLWLPRYWVYLLSTVAITAIVALSIGLVTNRTGIITLAQMSFAAIGGWIVAWLSLRVPDAPFVLLVFAGGMVAAAVGLLIGLATVRIRGVELAVVTLGFAAALDLAIKHTSFPGVGRGIAVLPAAPFDDARMFTALALVLLVALQLLLSWLTRTRRGLGWVAVRVSERSAASLGVRVGWSKASAFALGAAIAGTAGGMLAGQYGLLTSTVFTPLTSMVYLATAVLCGAAVFSGAVLAGLFGVLIPELLRRFGLPLDLGNALLALGAFDVLRRGNGGIMEQFTAWREGRRFANERVTCELLSTSDQLSGKRSAAATKLAAASTPLLITDVSVNYGGNRALDKVSLKILPGQVHALIGPNGSGKSTLVDAVTGFLPRYEGSVVVGGKQLDGFSARCRALAGVRRTFQQSRAIDSITVGEYLRLAAGPGARSPELVRELSEFFGLPDAALPIRLMDIGSRRILEIAAALAKPSTVLLLDEPAAGLDDEVSDALAARVRQIPARFGAAVLLIEHDMDFVRQAAAAVTVLDAGRVIASGPVESTLSDPRVVAAYTGQAVQ